VKPILSLNNPPQKKSMEIIAANDDELTTQPD
jgi:hypothetical protein